MKPSFHEDYRRKQEARRGSDRNFGITIGIALLLAGLWPLRTQHAVRIWALAAGVLLLVIAFARPVWLRVPNRIWTKAGLWIGSVTTPVITAILFFFAVTPTGLILRLLRKDPLRLRFERGSSSYWIERRPMGPPSYSMRNQF